MRQHAFGRMPFTVSDIGFGAWQIGGAWGDVSEADGRAALHAALDAGMTFVDTADVYGDGRSEKIIADVLKERGGVRPMVATKAGRRLAPHVADGYTKANLEAFIDRSLKNLAVDSLDLVQLHCPPTEVLYRQEVFAGLDELQKAGKIKGYGVSVEKAEEALKAIEFPGVVSIQIIYNIFRQRPADLFFKEAKRKNVAVIARVPLASGLLSLLAIAVMITYSVKNGIILLVLAFLISPMGLPLLAVQGLGKLQDVNAAMKDFIHS